MVDMIADSTTAVYNPTKKIGIKFSTIRTSTSSPAVPKIASGSCPISVNIYRPKIPIVTAAPSVNNVNKIATHRP